MQLTEKIYSYTWQGLGNNSNTYILAGEKKVLFDPGHVRNELNELCFSQLLRLMDRDGFSLESIDLVLCTHGHPDHCEGVVRFKENGSTYFALHQADEFFVEKLAGASGKGKAPLKPDFYLKEGFLEPDITGQEQIQVIHTPGHSPGSVAFYIPEEKALITGDTVFRGSIGRTDIRGGDMKALGDSVKKLSQLEDVEYLLPGHMDLVKGSESIKQNFSLIWNFFFAGM